MSIAEKLTQIAENEQKVYDAGVEAGKKSEWDTFWDSYQLNGTRTIYYNAFTNNWWSKANFKPKYDIIIGDGYDYGTNAFANINNNNGELIDMVALCEEQGIKIDTSQAKYLGWAFRGDGVSRWGETDVRNAINVQGIFYGNGSEKLKRIDKIISAETTPWASNSFSNQYGLTYIRFEGVIGVSFNLQHGTRLDKDSITSIVNCLSDTASGCTITLSKTAVDNAFIGQMTAEGEWDESLVGENSYDWQVLIANKTNWTFSLV